jgi:Ras-related protein Rab-1A
MEGEIISQSQNIQNHNNNEAYKTQTEDNKNKPSILAETPTTNLKNSAENYDESIHSSIKRVLKPTFKSDYSFRICVIGDISVGKTSILTRYCDNIFKEAYTNTIGVDFRIVSLRYKEVLAKVHIWDTAGQERFKSISINYFRSCHGFMFIYDITNKSSFTNLNRWMELAFSNNRMSAINFLVGNKNDLEEKREVSVEEAKQFANTMNLLYLETSAKNNCNVGKAFEYLTFKLIDYYTKHKKDYKNEKEEDSIKGDNINVKDLIAKKKQTCSC